MKAQANKTEARFSSQEKSKEEKKDVDNVGWSESLRGVDGVFDSPHISFSCSPRGNLFLHVITQVNTRARCNLPGYNHVRS